MSGSVGKPPLSDVTLEFGHRVRELRHGLGLSQEALAERSRLHWSYLGRVERGQVNLTLHNIVAISDVLDVDPGDLMKGLGRTSG